MNKDLKPQFRHIPAFWLGFLFLIFLALAGRESLAAQSRVPPPAPAFFQAIDRAKLLLDGKLKNNRETQKKPVIVDSRDVPLKITLAVWNQADDSIVLLEAVKNDMDLFVKTNFKWPIRVRVNNGVNSQYELPEESQSWVVGEIYPVFQDIYVGRRKRYQLNPVVYVPYSPEFYTSEIVAKGEEYIDLLIRDVLEELRQLKVKSLAFPKKLLAEAVDPLIIKSIMVIEHVHWVNDDDGEPHIGKFWVPLALNKGDTFNFSVSKAGARGIVQFMPSTYQRLIKRRPELKLKPDFLQGMVSHGNAIKAEVALLDLQLKEMEPGIKDLVKLTPVQTAELVAAAYNGGPARARRAWSTLGADWANIPSKQRQALSDKAGSLRYEINLLRKQLAKATGKESAKIKDKIVKAQKEREQAITSLSLWQRRGLKPETAIYVTKLRKVYQFFTNQAASRALAAQPVAPANTLTAADQTNPPGVVGSTDFQSENKICFDDGQCFPIAKAASLVE